MIAAGYLEKSASKQNFLSFNSQIDGNFHVGDFCLYTYTHIAGLAAKFSFKLLFCYSTFAPHNCKSI